MCKTVSGDVVDGLDGRQDIGLTGLCEGGAQLVLDRVQRVRLARETEVVLRRRLCSLPELGEQAEGLVGRGVKDCTLIVQQPRASEDTATKSPGIRMTPLVATCRLPDDRVNVADLGILGANYKQTGEDWCSGDFNGDGLVNVGDLGILGANYRWTLGGGGAVPEPASMAILGLGGMGLLFERRAARR